MARQYGEFSRKGAQKPTPPPAEILINITGRHTLEQITHEFQKAIAILQEHDVYGVEKLRMRFQPLDEKGARRALWAEDGKAIEKIDIPEVPATPPYRRE
jgi:hypothetical protein